MPSTSSSVSSSSVGRTHPIAAHSSAMPNPAAKPPTCAQTATFVVAPRGDSAGGKERDHADPHIEVRVTWIQRSRTGLPDGIYYIVAVPRGKDPNEYLRLFMLSLAGAVKEAGSGKIRLRGVGADYTRGFQVELPFRDSRGRHLRAVVRKAKNARGRIIGHGSSTDQRSLEIWVQNPMVGRGR